MAAAAAHAVKNNRKLHPKDGNASQVEISLHSKDGTVPILLHKCDQSSKSPIMEVVINSPARHGWGETAQALHGEIAQVKITISDCLQVYVNVLDFLITFL